MKNIIIFCIISILFISNISFAKSDFLKDPARLEIIENIKQIKKSYTEEEYSNIYLSCLRKNESNEFWTKRCYDKITGIQKLIDYCNNLFINNEEYNKCLDIKE